MTNKKTKPKASRPQPNKELLASFQEMKNGELEEVEDFDAYSKSLCRSAKEQKETGQNSAEERLESKLIEGVNSSEVVEVDDDHWDQIKDRLKLRAQAKSK